MTCLPRPAADDLSPPARRRRLLSPSASNRRRRQQDFESEVAITDKHMNACSVLLKRANPSQSGLHHIITLAKNPHLCASPADFKQLAHTDQSHCLCINCPPGVVDVHDSVPYFLSMCNLDCLPLSLPLLSAMVLPPTACCLTKIQCENTCSTVSKERCSI